MTTSKHYTQERKERQELIEWLGEGKVIFTTITTDPRRKKPYRYEITDNCVLKVWALDKPKLITQMIARPSRIKMFWADAPKWLLEKSAEYTRKGFYI